MSIGKWYITVGTLCIGVGRPPAHLYDQRLPRKQWVPLKPKRKDDNDV